MEPLRVGLMGFGVVAEQSHLPAYLESMRNGGPFKLVAVADVCAARRALARRLVPEARVYSDRESLLAAEIGRIDLVDIATPPCEHAAMASAAMDCGLDVLCEAPLASSVDDARDLHARARGRGRVLFPCHDYSHAPIAKSIRRVIDSGSIGEVRLVTLQTFLPTHARGVSEWRPEWRRMRAIAGGGVLVDQGTQALYLAFDWLGAYPTSVAASAVMQGAETEETISCTLRFPNNRLANLVLSWTGGLSRVLYTIHGERGAIRVEDDDIEVSTKKEQGDGKVSWETESACVPTSWTDASHVSWFPAVLAELECAINRRHVLSIRAEDAFRCVEVVDACYRSVRNGGQEIALHRGEPLFRRIHSALPA